MSTAGLHFYDAANPRNVPSGVHAGVYVNGYAWQQAEIDRMSGVFKISVLPESHWARLARCIDVENGAAAPANVPPFIHERRALGFTDATAYVNRSNWQQVWQTVRDAGMAEPLWWVSTLDGTTDVSLTVDGKVVARAWAVQCYGGATALYDVSILHGVNNFRKP